MSVEPVVSELVLVQPVELIGSGFVLVQSVELIGSGFVLVQPVELVFQSYEFVSHRFVVMPASGVVEQHCDFLVQRAGR